MQKKSLHIKHSWSVLLLLAALLGSCAEYESIFSSEYVPEGEPASITLTVQLPNMMSVTRAAGISPDNEQMSYVNDLWVAAYSVSTGKRSGTYHYTPNRVLGEYEDHEKTDDHVTIKDMKALSGANYIVAVANPSLNRGLDVKGGGEKSLLDLLKAADTWDKYKNLVVTLSSGPRSIQYSSEGILMTGIYYEGHNKYDYQAYVDENDNPTPMIIKPGENEMPGCIQLRRVASYVKFNIQVDKEYVDNEGDIINMKAVSWQVCNLPGVSYVHERKGSRNAADTEIIDLPDNYDDDSYHHSPVFEGAMTFPTSKDESNKNHIISSFDFYQMENKHTGTAVTYNKREEEFKTDGDDGGTNTGWYQSLVTKPGDEIPAKPSYTEDLSNNNASYVVIKAHLEYYYDADDKAAYKPVRYNPAKEQILRVADAIYTIHLGYCEGEGEKSKAMDFNCRRNTQYTYDVYIAGVDKIRVEAQKEGMTNGAEGLVTDVTGKVIKLDAHYGTFNIPLSDKDRMNLAWRIQTPFGDETIKLMYDNIQNSTSGGINLAQDGNKDKYDALSQNQFYNWVQFRPTSDEDVLAHYPGDPRLIGRDIEGFSTKNIKAVSDGGVWYLEELRDVVKYPHFDATEEYIEKLKNASNYDDDAEFQKEFNKERWYTVFVDEYVYEYAYAPGELSLTNKNVMEVKKAWDNFVNRDPRYVWLALSEFNSSSDDESFYANSAHIISQESIQTYYTGTGNDGQALGIEATNESYNEDYLPENGNDYIFGKKDGSEAERRKANLPEYNNQYEEANGRLNMKNYVDFFSDTSKRWEHIMNNDNKPRTNNTGTKTYYIPDHVNTFMAACLGRNRDLNNDSVIDVNEIRWYLPTTANYIQIILGSVSLRNPLFNFIEYGMDDIDAGTGKNISHFAASNNRMVWAEELAATGDLYRYGPASNFRCIRNLGQEMSAISNDIIAPAYSHNSTERTVELKYYDMSGLRDYTPGHIAAHSVAEILSFPSRKFQYAKENCSNINTQQLVLQYFDTEDANASSLKKDSVNVVYIDNNKDKRDFSKWWEILKNNTICGVYSEEPDGKDRGTWRTPNISELAILRVADIIPKGNSISYISSSYEYFKNRNGFDYNEEYHWFLGLVDNDISAGILDKNNTGRPLYLRCVRDVE